MEAEPDDHEPLRDRIRWGNVAWTLAALAVAGLVVAWPRLGGREPGLPPPAAAAGGPPAQAPASPSPAVTPPAASAAQGPAGTLAHARPRRPRHAGRRHGRAKAKTHRARVRAPAPAGVPDNGGSESRSQPAAPAGGGEFTPG